MKKKIVFTQFFISIISSLSSSTIFAKGEIFTYSGNHYNILYIFPLLALFCVCLFSARNIFQKKEHKEIGFLSITPHRLTNFFGVDQNAINMEAVVEALADENTNVYSNLSKITLSMKPNGLLVEDKNFKNSILINRRRSRRFLLNHGDIIDMGELTLMYVHPNQKRKENPHGYEQIPRNSKVTGKMLRNCPTLIPADGRKKTFYLTKNLTFIGCSDTNDLVNKTKSLSSRHAKIDRIAGKYKLVDLNSELGSFVNGRRVGETYLKDGDIIAFESVKYRFSATGKIR
ncbi:MAG: pSer/pThr/pTyr-binding forkhead associated (FHA) protein [bacterium]|jgi:pSer/pThr/pTyr-binding forkhead associated (FHA) protein